MSPFAIYSKTGKGVQEASGKTNLLDRADRAVLATIDGRGSVAELHERFGKLPERQFFEIVEKLESDGYIRQVSTGKARDHAPSTPSRSASENKSSLDQNTDLDFTSLGASSVSRPPPQVDLAAKARADAEARARAQAEARARAQAEAKAKAEAEAKARVQAEARARAERDAALKAAAEAKARAETEAKARAEAEARVKAARDAAVRAALEAKSRAEAELTAKLEAERRAREELERKLKEQQERLASESREVREEANGRVLTEVEELRQRLEEKRRAREDAERSAAGVGVHADAEGEKIKRDADELRERLAREEHALDDAKGGEREEADRREREEDERKKSLEESSLRAFAEVEAADAARKRQESEEAAKRQAEEREWKEQAERMRREQEQMQRAAEEEARKNEEERRAKEDEEKKKKFLETQTLFADLNAFSTKEVVARPDPPLPKPAPAPEKKPAPAAPAAPAAPSVRPDAPAARSGAFEERPRSIPSVPAKSKSREDRHARKRSEHGSDRAREMRGSSVSRSEVKPKPKEPAVDWKKVADRSKRVARKSGAVVALVGKQSARVAKQSAKLTKRAFAAVQAYRRSRAEQAEQLAKIKEREREKARARAEAKAESKAEAEAEARGEAEAPVADKVAPAPSREPSVSRAAAARARKPARWGARVGTVLFLLIAAAVGGIHVLPLETAPYEKALSEATGQPVRIGSATGWLITGPQLRFDRVRIGKDIVIGSLHASPDYMALLSGELALGRVDLERAVISGDRLGAVLFGAAKGGNLKGVRVSAKDLKLEGPAKLPALDAEFVLGADGRVISGKILGPDALNATLALNGGKFAIQATADKFVLPFVPGLELVQFTLRGSLTAQGMSVSAWDGVALGGVLSGTANVRWTDGWSIDGTLKGRAMEAGHFAPTLVSKGRAEGQGTYSMRARDISGLIANARVHGRFGIAQGMLTKVDLSRAVQTGGQRAVGQTPFLEMTGDVAYDRGAVVIRNAKLITGGALNADANLDITPSGSVSGSIVAGLTGRAQSLRTNVRISGTLEKLQVGNPQ